MSSEILEECLDIDKNEVSLTMNVKGYAWLAITSGSGDMRGDRLSFSLSPDNDGLKNAENISNAILSWSEMIQNDEIYNEDCEEKSHMYDSYIAYCEHHNLDVLEYSNFINLLKPLFVKTHADNKNITA